MKLLLTISLLISSVLCAERAHGGTVLFWSGNGSTEGGTGTWDTTNPRWGTVQTGPYTTVWNNANKDEATFTGTAGTVTLAAGVTVSNLTCNGSGTYTIAAGNTVTLGTTSTTINCASLFIISSDLVGSGLITKSGGNTLSIGHTGTLSYSGKWKGAAGTLSMASDTRFGPVPGSVTADYLTLDGGILRCTTAGTNAFSINRGLTLGSGGGTLNPSAASATMQWASKITGSGKLTISTGTGATVQLSNTGNDYTGNTAINSGAILQLIAAGVIPDASLVTVAGTFDLNNNNETVKSISGAGSITLGTGTLTLANPAGETFSGAISETGKLVKNGTGMITLSGANSFTGSTTVNAGTLQLGVANALATSPVILAGAATLDLNNLSPSVRALIGGGDAVGANSGTLTINGNLTTGSSTVTYSCFFGTITNTDNLTKDGTSAMALRGQGIFSGFNVTVTAGTLSVGAAAQSLPTATVLSVGTGGLFQLDANSQTVGSLSGSGGINLGGGTLTIDQTAATTFSGVIQNSELAGSSTSSGHGLRGYYYDNEDFTNLKAVRDDATVNFSDLTSASQLPAAVYPNTNQLTIRWLGQVLSTATGTYTFSTRCDDGQRLWVNGTLLVDDWNTHGATTKSGAIALAANTRYDIVMEYFNQTGPCSAQLLWTPPGDSSVIVPSDHLFLPGPGALVKAGAGTLTLTNANTYSGSTTVSGGTLEVQSDSGLGGGNAAVADGATLTLDSGATNGYMSTAADLLLSGTSPLVNLNFTGTENIHGLSYNGGTTYQAAGTYGATGSGATHQDSRFSGTGILNVTAGPSSVALVSSGTPAVYGTTVTFTATVTGAAPTPTGTVSFYDGANLLGTGALNGSGVATLGVNNLLVTASPHSVTAVYSGDGSHAASTSSALSQSTTAVTVPASSVVISTRAYDGTSNATIAAVAPSGVLSGDTNYVHFSGTAFFADKNVGTNKPVSVTGLTLTGSLAGNYAVSASSVTVSGTITSKALTVTGITASNKVYNATTAAVINTSAATLVGVVTNESVTLNTAGAVGNFADPNVGTNKTVTITGLTVTGADAGNYTVTSPTTTAAITAANSQMTLTTSGTPTNAGANVTFTATLSAVAPGAGTPTSNVVFVANSTPFSTNALVSGSASASTASLPPGTNTITARYAGDGNFIGVTNSLQQVINASCSQTNRLLSILNNANGTFTLNFQGTPQAQYYVLTHTNVSIPTINWSALAGSTNTVTNGSGLWSLTVTNTGTGRFYRSAAIRPCP